MSSTFKVLFYLRKNYLNKSGNAGIMIRVTLNGEMVQFSSKLDVDPNLWDTKSGKVAGKSLQSSKMNALMDNMRASIINHYREIEIREAHVTAEKIRNAFLGVTVKGQMLLETFRQHNEEVGRLIGITKSKATAQKYGVTFMRLENFMKYQYNITDIALKEVHHKFITDFETYLLTVCSCNPNTTAKFMQFFKRIIIIGKNNGWIHADPFANYKIRIKTVDRGYLTQEEIEALMQKTFSVKRLEQVRDIFVFSCFCGLAYIDVKNLRETNIRTSFDGGLWIMGKREKTGVNFNVPLLDVPQIILDKYKGTLPNKYVLPVLSNQKMNAYLKEIGDLCGIDKLLTFHLRRHRIFSSPLKTSKLQSNFCR